MDRAVADLVLATVATTFPAVDISCVSRSRAITMQCEHLFIGEIKKLIQTYKSGNPRSTIY